MNSPLPLMPMKRTSRALVRGAAGVIVSVLLIDVAAAQNARVQTAAAEWEQRFDSAPAAARMPKTSVPILSTQTLESTQQALQHYIEIESAGGWPSIPDGPMLKLGSRSPAVRAIRERLAVSGDLPVNAGAPDVFDSYVDAAVRRFQARHGLIVNGAVGPDSRAAMNVPASTRRHQMETSLGRLAALTRKIENRFVMVNIPAAQIEAVSGGTVDLRHTAVVGKADRQSPQLAVKIQEVNFNPYWTVPASIIRKDLIPKMQQEPDYLTKNNIRIYTQRGEELQPEQVNWNSTEAMGYRFTQDPGDLNSMGSIRINMPNTEGVYMHDTPSKGLFGENNRFHSSGCVRVQNVRELVDWLLRGTPNWERPQIDAAIRSGKRIDAKLSAAVPVHWVYITAWADADGVVQFRDDIYNQDGVGQLASAEMSVAPHDTVSYGRQSQ
ncbi:L,D-transpeptidase family protein [Terrihabitans sp. B22-R8]|uniref:L,D-transpeptidase family protein n=1 Tax=Terrihabitans sp. B22-R8 TaxID=3425128 RepID=UPI00403D0320